MKTPETNLSLKKYRIHKNCELPNAYGEPVKFTKNEIIEFTNVPQESLTETIIFNNEIFCTEIK